MLKGRVKHQGTQPWSQWRKPASHITSSIWLLSSFWLLPNRSWVTWWDYGYLSAVSTGEPVSTWSWTFTFWISFFGGQIHCTFRQCLLQYVWLENGYQKVVSSRLPTAEGDALLIKMFVMAQNWGIYYDKYENYFLSLVIKMSTLNVFVYV